MARSVRLLHTEFKQSNFKSLPHRELSKRVSKIKCIFVTQNMQDNNEWFTLVFIVQKEACKRKLIKKKFH